MENTRTKTTRNSLILLLTAAIWGMAFVSQSKGMDYMHSGVYSDQQKDCRGQSCAP